MNAPGISARVVEFVAENIDSVPQLEALLLLWQDPNKEWGIEDIAVRLYVSIEDAAAILHALHMRRLITTGAQPAVYRYSANWDSSGTIMSEVAQTHRHNLIGMTKFIHSRASSAVRAFARAFDLKKDK